MSTLVGGVFITFPKSRQRHWHDIRKCSCGRVRFVRAGVVGKCYCAKRGRPLPFKVPGRELRTAWKAYKSRSARRGLAMVLTLDQFFSVASKPCTYCGAEPKKRRQPDCPAFHGIDRVDSALGYVEGNITPACQACNRMKSDMPADEFLRRVKTIAARFGG